MPTAKNQARSIRQAEQRRQRVSLRMVLKSFSKYRSDVTTIRTRGGLELKSGFSKRRGPRFVQALQPVRISGATLSNSRKNNFNVRGRLERLQVAAQFWQAALYHAFEFAQAVFD